METQEKKVVRRAGPIDPRLLRRAKATRTYMISGVAVGSLTAVMILFQARLLSSTIADVFSTHTTQGLGLALALLGLVLLGRGVLNWASSWLAQRTAAAVKSQLRHDIISARLASPANHTSTSSSLVTLVTQGLDALDGYFSKYLPQLLLAVTVPLIIGAAILFSDWRIALIIAATIPFIPVLMALVGWATEARVKKRWTYQSRLASHFADLVAGLPTLQVFGRAKAQAKGLLRTESANRRETMGILRVSFLSAFVLELFSTIAVAVVAVTIGTWLVFGDMDFATALFVLILAPEVYLPIRQVGVHYHDSADGLAAAEAAFAEIDSEGEPRDEGKGRARQNSASTSTPVPPAGASERREAPPSPDTSLEQASSPALGETPANEATISVRGLRHTYHGSATTVGPFDLEVAPGEIVALSGRSGGGKTTLLNCILGFLKPDGETHVLTLGGDDSSQIDWDAWRQSLAYVPQVPGMVDGTIADNVRLGYAQATDEQVRKALDLAGASTLELTRSVGEEGEGLSVGERRRVGVARALARIELGGARLLILDEPTAGLDSDTEAQVLVSVKQSGATALVVSHRPTVLAAADRIVEITSPIEHGATARHESLALGAKAGSEEGAISDGDIPPLGHTGETARSDRPEPWSQEATLAAPNNLAGGVDAIGGNSSEHPLSDDVGQAGDEAPQPDTPADRLDVELPSELDSATRRRGSPLMRLVTGLLDSVPGARARLIMAVLLAAAASGAAVALMGVSAWLISKAAQHPPFLELSVAAVGVRFFGISRGVFRYIERLVGHDVALRMQSALRLKTYQRLSRTTLLGRRQGDLLVRVVSDVSAIDDVVVRIIQPFAAAALVVVTVCAMLFRFSPLASGVILFSAVLGGIVVPWLTARVSRQADMDAVPLRGELGVVVHGISRTAADLSAYGATASSVDKMLAVDARLRRTEERAALAQGIGAGLQTIAAGLGFLGGLWIGAEAVSNGTMGERLLAVLVLTPLALHEVFSNFSQAAQTMTRARVALDRVVSILEAPSVGRGDVDMGPPDQEPEVECANLEIGWPDHPSVASHLDLSVRDGETVAVTGPSGIGKTTLAATIMGLIPPVSGRLTVRGRIGYLAQDAHIFATTVAENVRIGNKDATDEQVLDALREAGLSIALDREVGEMGSTLSGGEARRLALSRLFVGDYRLLILDEPTEHLDRPTADALMDDLFSQVSLRPLLVISHDESAVARCGEVLDMGRR